MRLLVALALVFAFPSCAGAVTLVTPDGQVAQPYQRWADEARVPTPPGRVVVVRERCPTGSYESCAATAENGASEDTIYLLPGRGRDASLHELGHIYAAHFFGPYWRQRFTTVTGVTRGWRDGEHDDRLEEWFAGAYATCATTAIRSTDMTTWYTANLMRWHPTGRVLARACFLIRLANPIRMHVH